MKEIWKDILGYENLYQISNLGRVKSLAREIWKKTHWYSAKEIILKQSYNKNYYFVILHKNKKIKLVLIHRLVAQAFIPNPENKPQINHIDGNKLNNRIDNLEWCTQSENMKHAFAIGLQSIDGEKHPSAKLKEKDVIFIRKKLKNRRYNKKELAKKFNISTRHITAIKNRRYWKHI